MSICFLLRGQGVGRVRIGRITIGIGGGREGGREVPTYLPTLARRRNMICYDIPTRSLTDPMSGIR